MDGTIEYIITNTDGRPVGNSENPLRVDAAAITPVHRAVTAGTARVKAFIACSGYTRSYNFYAAISDGVNRYVSAPLTGQLFNQQTSSGKYCEFEFEIDGELEVNGIKYFELWDTTANYIYLRLHSNSTHYIYADWDYSAPAAPVILYPLNSPAETVSLNPTIIVTIPPDLHDINRTLYYKYGAGTWQAVTGATGIDDGSHAVGVHTPGAGTHSFKLVDYLNMESDVKSVQITVDSTPFTDSPIVAGTTPIKAAHINELRAAVDTLNGYFNRPAIDWGGDVIAGTTSYRLFKMHIAAIRAALESVAAHFAALTGTTVFPIPQWTNIDDAPRAAAVEEIRAMIRRM